MILPPVSDIGPDTVRLHAELELGQAARTETGSSPRAGSWLAAISLRVDRSLVADNFEHIVLGREGELLSRSPWPHGDCLWAGQAVLLPPGPHSGTPPPAPITANVVASSCDGTFRARLIQAGDPRGGDAGGDLDLTVEAVAASVAAAADARSSSGDPSPRTQLLGVLERGQHVAYRSSEAVAFARRRALAASGVDGGVRNGGVAGHAWAFCGSGDGHSAAHGLHGHALRSDPASPPSPHRAGRRLLSSPPAAASLGRKWVELLAVNDRSRSQALGSAALASSAAIVQSAAALYAGGPFGYNLTVQLRAQVSLPFGDPWSWPGPCSTGTTASCDPETEIDTSALLSSFSSWREQAVAAGLVPAHDNAALFSHLNFGGSVVGLAHKPGMCSASRSSTVNQVTNPLAFNAALLAHEIGHNFGLSHNEELTCGATGRIMDGIVDFGRPAPTSWSNCSAAGMDVFFRGNPAGCSGGGCVTQATYGSGSYPSCLESAATQLWTAAPECGNGVVEAGEDCDCGVHNCTQVDPCCDGELCRLLPAAQCSARDGCCDNSTCALLGAGQPLPCRPSTGPCDVAELCLGDAGACPEDGHRAAGERCPSDAVGGAAAVGNPSLYDGACFGAACRSHGAQCKASESLFGSGSLTHCSAFDEDNGDSACGELWCGAGAGTCLRLPGFLFVADGTPCAADRQCRDRICVSSATVRAQQTGVYWHVGPWTQPAGANGTQWRLVECRRLVTLAAAPDADCEATSSLTDAPVAGDRPASERHWPFHWQLSAWSACSAACGNGTRTRTASCHARDSGAAAPAARCAVLPSPRLDEWCRAQSCAANASFDVGPWGECSARCGVVGTQLREVVCRAASGAEAAPGACERNETVVEIQWANQTSGNGTDAQPTQVAVNVTLPVPPPPSKQPCNRFPCPAYVTGALGACSASCGTGSATRTVQCLQPDGSAALTDCVGPKPSSAVPCATGACYRWQVGDWGSCEASTRTRAVHCADAAGAQVEARVDTCAAVERPATSESCVMPVISGARARWGDRAAALGALVAGLVTWAMRRDAAV